MLAQPHRSHLKGDSGVSPPPRKGGDDPFLCPTTPISREIAGCRPLERGGTTQQVGTVSGATRIGATHLISKPKLETTHCHLLEGDSEGGGGDPPPPIGEERPSKVSKQQIEISAAQLFPFRGGQRVVHPPRKGEEQTSKPVKVSGFQSM